MSMELQPINIQTTIELSEDEAQALKEVLPDEEHSLFQDKLNKVASAAVEEYCRMILGQKVLGRANDIREYRLRLLIKTLYNNTIPSEQAVSALFQTTPSESKALIRSTALKYKYELKEALHATLKGIIKKAENMDQDGTHYVIIDSPAQVDELNRILLSENGIVPKIKKDLRTLSQYIITESSYAILKDYFKL